MALIAARHEVRFVLHFRSFAQLDEQLTPASFSPLFAGFSFTPAGVAVRGSRSPRAYLHLLRAPRRGWCVLGHQPVVTLTLCVPVRRLRRCVSELWLLPWPPSRAWPGPRARSLLFASSCLLKTTGVVGRGSRIQSVLDSGEKGTLSNKFPGGWIRIPCQANPGNNVLDGGEEWRARRLASLNHVVFGDADASATLANAPAHPIFTPEVQLPANSPVQVLPARLDRASLCS